MWHKQLHGNTINRTQNLQPHGSKGITIKSGTQYLKKNTVHKVCSIQHFLQGMHFVFYYTRLSQAV